MTIEELLKYAPLDLIEIENSSAERVRFFYSFFYGQRPKPIRLQLEILKAKKSVAVREVKGKERYPAFCPDRHINKGGTFCLGLDAGNNISTAGQARVWWARLATYLKVQETASLTKRWPRSKALAHGDAGYAEQTARKIAARIDCIDDYEAHLNGGENWISKFKVRLNKQTKSAYCNGRSTCPKDCKDRRGRTILRRDCPNRKLLFEFLKAEYLRDRAEAKFIDDLKAKGAICCGTLRKCCLK